MDGGKIFSRKFSGRGACSPGKSKGDKKREQKRWNSCTSLFVSTNLFAEKMTTKSSVVFFDNLSVVYYTLLVITNMSNE